MSASPLERLRALAARIESRVPDSFAEQIAVRSVSRAQSGAERIARRRLAVVGVSAVAIFAAGGVLGAIADQAVPGDVLYSVDRAYEWVGRFVGPNAPSSEERLMEAITLIDRGREQEAVELIRR